VCASAQEILEMMREKKYQMRGSGCDSFVYFFCFVVVAFLAGAAALRLGRVGGSGSSSD
jgi:hypothetical protein